jgi:tetratricopeptide (TPR) repeat protein
MAMGRLREAIGEIERARTLDPLNSRIHSSFGRILFRAHRYEEASQHCLRAIELDPHNLVAYKRLGDIYAETGRLEEARSMLDQQLRGSGADSVMAPELARVYALLGRRAEALEILRRLSADTKWPPKPEMALAYFALKDSDRGFQWLRQAFDDRQVLVLFMKYDSRFEAVRADPRFQDLISRLNIPDHPAESF